MADPLTLAVLGGAVLTEGIRFLYRQAEELIKVGRERRHRARAGASASAEAEVPAVPADVLDGSLPTQVDGAVLDQIGDRLPALAEPLARYVGADASVDPRDEQLLTAVDRLRRSLEAVYGQRLTLDGEDRPPTGTRVDVEQLLDEVEGYVVGIQADQIDRDTHLNVDQKAKKVAPGGTLHGAVLGSIGRSTP